MAPKKGNDPPPAATPTGDSTGLPVFSDEALAAESFSLEAPFEDELGAKLPVGLSAGMIQWRRPSEFLSELLVEPAEGVEAVVPFVVQPPPPPAEGEEEPPPRDAKRAGGGGAGGGAVDGAVARLVLPAHRAPVHAHGGGHLPLGAHLPEGRRRCDSGVPAFGQVCGQAVRAGSVADGGGGRPDAVCQRPAPRPRLLYT